MALAYKDIYKTDEFVTRVDQLQIEISKQIADANGLVTTARFKLIDQINKLKQKEETIFAIFGVKNIDELNKRIEDFRNATINFNGPALYENFTGVLEAENAKEFEYFRKAVNEVIQTDILGNSNIAELGVEYVRGQVLNILNEGQSSRRHFWSSKGMTGPKFFPNSFTKEQKRRWEEILKQRLEESQSKGEISSDALKNWYISVTSNGNSLQASFNWFDKKEGTAKLTRTEAIEKYKNGSNPKLQAINKKIKNYILSYVDQDRDIIENIIDREILQQDPFAFFVGKNVNEIIGLLGEIQGVYYLNKLLGYKNTLSADIAWKGGLISKETGVKPHQDIVIKSILGEFGVQIKNTTSEYEARKEMGILDIKFTDVSMDTVFKKMQTVMNVNDDTMELLKTFYGTLGFNIPYHFNKEGKAVKDLKELKPRKNTKKNMWYNQYVQNWNMATNNYRTARQKLESLDTEVDKLMSVFSAAFMYLDVFDYEKGGDFNSLFLIGGAAFIAASHILETVLEDLQNQERIPHFSINLDMKMDKNIITALNSNTRDDGYSSSVIKDIKLTSSFKF